MNFLFYFIFLFNIYFLQALESSMEMKIDASEQIDVSNDFKDEKLPINIEDLSHDEMEVLEALKMRYNQYQPLNFYEMDQNDPYFDIKFREQIFRNNTHFFDMPQKIIDQENKIRKELNFPSIENQKRFEDKKDPFLLQEFDSQEQTKLFHNFYRNQISSAAEKYRFTQLDPKFYKIAPPASMLKIRNKQQIVGLYDCWASSRLDRLWRHEVFVGQTSKIKPVQGHDFGGYPCVTNKQSKQIHSGYWISGPQTGRNRDKKIYFRADLQMIMRVVQIHINWIGKTSNWQLQSTQDMNVWEDAITDKQVNQKWFGSNSYIVLKDPLYTRGIRLIMTTSGRYIGFSALDVFIGEHTTIIQLKKDPTQCLAKSDGDFFNPGGRINLVPCVEAIAQGDSREVFVINLKSEIQTFLDNLCVQMADGPGNDKPFATAQCDGSAKQKFRIDRTGQIASYQMSGYCVLAYLREQIEYDDVAFKGNPTASSTFDQDFHGPQKAIDHTSDGYWMSQTDKQKDWFRIAFDGNKTVAKIHVRWKFPPQKYDIQLERIGGIWENVKEYDNAETEIILEFPASIAIGARILMHSYSPICKQSSGNYVYGLFDFRVQRNAHEVFVAPCLSGVDDCSHRWMFEDVNYIATAPLQLWHKEKTELLEEMTELLEIVKDIVVQKNKISDMIIQNEEKKDDLQEMLEEFEQMEKKQTQFKEWSNCHKDGQGLNENCQIHAVGIFLQTHENIQMNNKSIFNSFLEFDEDVDSILPSHIINSKIINVKKNRKDREILRGKLRRQAEKNDEFKDVNINLDENQIQGNHCLGCHRTTPAASCNDVISQNLHKKRKLNDCKSSGFYWIKTLCFNEPQRVYCDFSTGSFYKFFGQSAYTNQKLEKQLTVEKIQNYCNSIGLYPVEFDPNNIQTMKAVIQYVKTQGVDTNNGIVPLAYDWGCDDDKIKCTRTYRSLNSKISSELEYYQTLLDMTNPTNMEFTIGGERRDIVAIGESLDQMIYSDLRGASVKGIVCSDNTHSLLTKTFQEDSAIKVDCTMTVENNFQLKSAFETQLKIKCDSGCLDFENTKIYGSNPYAENSYLCRAAYHAGFIKNTGGIFQINIVESQNDQDGSFENGIQSENFKHDSVKSVYVISELDKGCPKEVVVDEDQDDGDNPSFIEQNEKITLKPQKKKFHKKFSSSFLQMKQGQYGNNVYIKQGQQGNIGEVGSQLSNYIGSFNKKVDFDWGNPVNDLKNPIHNEEENWASDSINNITFDGPGSYLNKDSGGLTGIGIGGKDSAGSNDYQNGLGSYSLESNFGNMPFGQSGKIKGRGFGFGINGIGGNNASNPWGADGIKNFGNYSRWWEHNNRLNNKRDPEQYLKTMTKTPQDIDYQFKHNCTIDPNVKVVYEMYGDKKRIKWCNGYGERWKYNWDGQLLGVDPELHANGRLQPSAQHTYNGRNILTNAMHVMGTSDPRHDNFVIPKNQRTAADMSAMVNNNPICNDLLMGGGSIATQKAEIEQLIEELDRTAVCGQVTENLAKSLNELEQNTKDITLQTEDMVEIATRSLKLLEFKNKQSKRFISFDIKFDQSEDTYIDNFVQLSSKKVINENAEISIQQSDAMEQGSISRFKEQNQNFSQNTDLNDQRFKEKIFVSRANLSPISKAQIEKKISQINAQDPKMDYDQDDTSDDEKKDYPNSHPNSMTSKQHEKRILETELAGKDFSLCAVGESSCRTPSLESEEFIDACTATVELVKFKEMYDAEVKWQMMYKKQDGMLNFIRQGIAGIVFRFIDQFNYYTAEVYNEYLYFKLMRHGLIKTLNKVKMEEYLPQSWYQFELTAVRGVFNLRVYKMIFQGESKSVALNHILSDKPVALLEAKNMDIRVGGVGYFTDGDNSVCFDELEIKQLPCVKVEHHHCEIEKTSDSDIIKNFNCSQIEKCKNYRIDMMNSFTHIAEFYKLLPSNDNLVKLTEAKNNIIIIQQLCSDCSFQQLNSTFNSTKTSGETSDTSTDTSKQNNITRKNTTFTQTDTFKTRKITTYTQIFKKESQICSMCPDERKNYCNSQFLKKPAHIKNCNKNFCETCCDLKTDGLNEVQSFQCIKQCKEFDDTQEKCQSKLPPSIIKHAEHTCKNPHNIDSSIYNYCQQTDVRHSVHQFNCAADMCRLCCVLDVELSKIQITEMQIKKCFDECGYEPEPIIPKVCNEKCSDDEIKYKSLG